MPRLRPRISLLTAILLTTIVGLSIVTIQLWWEVEPLRDQVRSMRSELGLLNIDDPSRVYAVRVPTFEDDTWKWRIYLPPGGQYSLNLSSGHLPSGFDDIRKAGAGMSSSGSSLQGEFLLEGRLVKENDTWMFVTNNTHRIGSSTSSSSKDKGSIYQPSGDWLSDRRSRITSSGVSHVQKTFDPGKSILLLHMVRPEIFSTPGGGYTSKSPQGPAEGFAVWIEQQLPATKSPVQTP